MTRVAFACSVCGNMMEDCDCIADLRAGAALAAIRSAMWCMPCR